MKYAVKQQYGFESVLVTFSDGSLKIYDTFELGCKWFKMSNDTFFELYGFNFNPHKIPGLYEKCRRAVYSNDQ